jgi:fatty acid desaturase
MTGVVLWNVNPLLAGAEILQPSDCRLSHDELAPYARPCPRRSVSDIFTSAVPYLAVCVLMYLALGVSYLLTLALVLPAAGFLVRTFVVFHDCAHG